MRIRRTCLLLPLLLAVLLAACTDGDGPWMRQQLEELEDMNLADSVMTNDTLAERLVEYFDRHGTPNERMRAHYILGRTYADMGDYPSAVEAYLDASCSTDTSRSDCDFRRLSRVYGQMSILFYRQHMLETCLDNLEYSVDYAWRAKDTAQALNTMAYMIPVLFKLHQDENAVSLYDTLYSKTLTFRGTTAASRYCMMPVDYLLKTKDYPKAKECIDCYEAYSCYFDTLGNIARGREVFYYYKGMYYLNVQQYDSAEVLFRKELQEGHDVNNQNAASRGLALLFQRTNRLDSAVKYALYSYEMNDSVYSLSTSEEMEKTRSLYDYRRHQKEADKEKRLAEQQKRRNWYLLFGIVLICICFIAVWIKNRHELERRTRKNTLELEKANTRLQELQAQKNYIENLLKEQEMIVSKATNELQQLRQHESDFKTLLKEKEQSEGQLKEELGIMHKQEVTLQAIIAEKQQMVSTKEMELKEIRREKADLESKIAEKQAELSVLHNQLMVDNQDNLHKKSLIDKQLKSSLFYKNLHNSSDINQKLSEKEWDGIEKMLMDIVPNYYIFMTSKKGMLNKTEYRLCHLLRLDIEMKRAGVLIGITQTHVSRTCSTVMVKLFDEKGAGRELQKRLKNFF